MSASKKAPKKWKKGQAVVPLLTSAEHDKFLKATYSSYTTNNIIFNGTSTGTSTGNYPEYNREYELEKIIKPHSKGYYFVMSVSDTEDVFFQIWDGGKLACWLHKITGHTPVNSEKVGNTEWQTVRKRTHLPATLGAAYKEIDAAVEAHKETLEHDEYVAGLLKTEPENLKMIEGLEKLQEGDPDDNVAHQAPTYSSNINVSGSSQIVSGAGSFYMFAPQLDPSVEVPGDMNIKGTLRVDGQTIEKRISDAIRDQTDKMMMDLFKDGTTESAGKADQ